MAMKRLDQEARSELAQSFREIANDLEAAKDDAATQEALEVLHEAIGARLRAKSEPSS